MGRLYEVTSEQAEKLLKEVEFGQHIQGTRSAPMSGGLPFIITSLEEANEFLYLGSPESLKTVGGRGIVSYLDLNELKTWIEKNYGDIELAAAIGEEIEKGSCYADQVGPVKQLMAERLEQCRAKLKDINK